MENLYNIETRFLLVLAVHIQASKLVLMKPNK